MSRKGRDYFEQNLEQVRQETLNSLINFRKKNSSLRSLFGRIELLIDDYRASFYIKGLEKRKEDRAYIWKAREFAYDMQVSYF